MAKNASPKNRPFHCEFLSRICNTNYEGWKSLIFKKIILQIFTFTQFSVLHVDFTEQDKYVLKIQIM